MMREANGNVVPRVGPDIEGAIRYWGYQEPVTDTYPRLAENDTPVLLLTAPADADDRLAADAALLRFQRALPHAIVRPLAGGHDLVSDAGPEVAETVGDWLIAIASGRSAPRP